MKYMEKRPIIMLVIGVLGISLSAIFVKLSNAPSSVTAAYRLLWTVLLMSPSMLIRKEMRQELLGVNRRVLGLSALSGALLALHFFTWFESLNRTSVASSTIIVCTESIWVALGYCIFLGGRLKGKEVVAIIISFAGSIIVAVADSSAGGNSLNGDLWSLIAALAVAAYTLLGRVVRKEAGNGVYTYIVYVSCSVVLVVLTFVQGLSLVGYGYRGPLSGLLLAFFSTILGHSVFSWCLKYFSPAFVSASKLCEPVIAGIVAMFLFREVPGILQILGSVIILAGVVFYTKVELTE